MPVLNWIGKDKIVNHDKGLPFRVLKPNKKLSVGDSNNLLIQGDNLEALKALMPFYYGQVRRIYIDPPYNTGSEKWIYNDKVNAPQIKQWLAKVVGGEGEDLCRHDKWLCMMYPRLKLLRDLLRDGDGLIFISIDDNEVVNLRKLCDEIFGEKNFVHQITWKNKYGPGAGTKGFGNIHEYILCYSKTPVTSIEAPLSEEERKKYKSRDDRYPTRGGYITQPLATRSKDDRPNLVYPLSFEGEEVWPDKQWIWSKDRMTKAIKNNEVVFNKKDGNVSVRFKQYLRDENGTIRKGKPLSILNGPFNQEGSKELREIFGKAIFQNPKPTSLVKYLFSIIVNGDDSRDGIYLDSFAGSGTTGQAVLELNKEDDGDRKVLLVELEKDIAEKVTAQRLKKVTKGFDGALHPHGTAQGFEYLDLNGELFDQDGFINSDAEYEDLASYVYYTETKSYAELESIKAPFIGASGKASYYLLFKEANKNVLNEKFFDELKGSKGTKVVYADKSLIDEEALTKYSVIFKQIPYELKKF